MRRSDSCTALPSPSFYAIFGIPLGKLADNWSRKSLISVGLGFWSLMTALSGTARSFFSLAAYRVGVGIGEASATPAAFSMLSDYFPPKLRATVLAIYSSGIYIGAGIGIFLGGWIVEAWQGMYPDPADAPFGLKGWQAAYMAVGLPGLLMALWVFTLREPVRGGQRRHRHGGTSASLPGGLARADGGTAAVHRGDPGALGRRRGRSAVQPDGRLRHCPGRLGPVSPHRGPGAVDRARHRYVRRVFVGAGPRPARSGDLRDDVPEPRLRLRDHRLPHHLARQLCIRRLGAAVLPARPRGGPGRGRPGTRRFGRRCRVARDHAGAASCRTG